MRYLKLILSAILALVIAAIIIWFGFFVLVFSVVVAPFVTLFSKRMYNYKTKNEPTEKPKEKESSSDYKIIEAEYEIIDK